jgi:hypothetical protein
MNRVVARLLTRMYSRAWQERYNEEFEVLLQDGRVGLHTSANVLCSALRERILPTRGGKMDHDPNSFGAIVKHPSAFLPVAMSLSALAMLTGAMVHGYITGYHLVREPDEGAVAHLWQLLMAGQLPILAFFAIKWLPRAPRQSLYVLALQAAAVLASMAPVYFLNL